MSEYGRRIVVGALVAFIIAASLGAAILYLAPNLTRQSSTYNPTTTVACCSISNSLSSHSTGGCVVTMSGPLLFYVFNSTDKSPVASLPIQVSERPFQQSSCSYGSEISLGTVNTDANGSISVCCTADQFLFVFTYDLRSYELNETVNGAGSAECVSFYVPASNLTTAYSQPFAQNCNPSSTVYSYAVPASFRASPFTQR